MLKISIIKNLKLGVENVKNRCRLIRATKTSRKVFTVFKINNKNINMYKFLYYILTVLFNSNKINLLNK